MQIVVVAILVGMALVNLVLGALGRRGRMRLATRLEAVGPRLPGAGWMARRLRREGEAAGCAPSCEGCAFWRPGAECAIPSSPGPAASMASTVSGPSRGAAGTLLTPLQGGTLGADGKQRA